MSFEQLLSYFDDTESEQADTALSDDSVIEMFEKLTETARESYLAAFALHSERAGYEWRKRLSLGTSKASKGRSSPSLHNKGTRFVFLPRPMQNIE